MGVCFGRDVTVSLHRISLFATLTVPEPAFGLVIFAHGSGSSRHSLRNRFVANVLQDAGFATLLMDLLTPQDERIDVRTGELRFDIDLLADRLVAGIDWVEKRADTRGLPIGLFGASTGAAAALVAAARRPRAVRAVVSRGGRPDLAGDALGAVEAATLLTVGGVDHPVIALNRQAFRRLGAMEKSLEIVPGAGHLFEEPGVLEEVAEMACDWFERHLGSEGGSRLAHASTYDQGGWM